MATGMLQAAPAHGLLGPHRPCCRRSVEGLRCRSHLQGAHSAARAQQQPQGPAERQQQAPCTDPEPASRRGALGLLAAALLLPAAPVSAEPELAEFPAPTLGSSSSSADVDTTVTHRLFLDIGLCEGAVVANRTLGSKTPFCENPEPLGRVVIDLYGKAARGSVANIVAAVQAGAYDSTQFSKVLPGRFLVAGAQGGGKRSGMVQAPLDLPPNPDILSSAAFRLQHRRPGTVSLNLSESEDGEFARYNQAYRNLSLLITTGPGPVPSLDGENIVVGQVSEGLDVVAAITQVPTFTPNDNSRAFNQFASVIGDERAAKTRSKWGRPLRAVVIIKAGVL